MDEPDDNISDERVIAMRLIMINIIAMTKVNHCVQRLKAKENL